MVSHGFRHLVVVSGSELAGMLSMRDLVRCYVEIEDAAEAVAAAAAPGASER